MSASTLTGAALEAPTWNHTETAGQIRIGLAGDWSAEHAPGIEVAVAQICDVCQPHARIVLDLSAMQRLDTAAAWLIDRTRHELVGEGHTVTLSGARDEHRILIDEVDHYDIPKEHKADDASEVTLVLSGVGHGVVDAGGEVMGGLRFLGEFVVALGKAILHPGRFRGTALVAQLDRVGLRGVPIIALISFLVGGIIAQQGIFQLRRFGGGDFVVDLVGILTLRELGVLLTAIIIAGRSGSSFTAEIGSMKMREEIDAIRVMGLDPMEVLIIPRILALLIALPLLTFLSDMSALLGGGLVAWLYDGMSPTVFLSRLKDAILLNTFLVGLIKAPFMALIIGLIAAIEGLAVKGSAESLGEHVTASVVKGIFMVIVVDGLFAIFFAAIAY